MATDTAPASATDRDADNPPDELEPGLGLDPTNPDTGGDALSTQGADSTAAAP